MLGVLSVIIYFCFSNFLITIFVMNVYWMIQIAVENCDCIQKPKIEPGMWQCVELMTMMYVCRNVVVTVVCARTTGIHANYDILLDEFVFLECIWFSVTVCVFIVLLLLVCMS